MDLGLVENRIINARFETKKWQDFKKSNLQFTAFTAENPTTTQSSISSLSLCVCPCVFKQGQQVL